MDETPRSETDRPTLWAYPDDDEVNVYALGVVRLLCDHPGHGIGDPEENSEARRTTRSTPLPTFFEVVADVDKGWEGFGAVASTAATAVAATAAAACQMGGSAARMIEILTSEEIELATELGEIDLPWRVRPDQVVIHAPQESEITVEGADALYDAEVGGYTFIATPPDLSDAPDVLDPSTWEISRALYQDYPVHRAGSSRPITTVRAYAPGEIKVSLSFPPLRTKRRSNKGEFRRSNRELAAALGEAEATRADRGMIAASRQLVGDLVDTRVQEISRDSSSWSPIRQVEETAKHRRTWTDEAPREEGAEGEAQITADTRHERGVWEAGAKVTVSYNGVDLSASYTEVVQNVKKLSAMLDAISDAFKKVPKVGWYVDLSWQPCSGSLELACQMREAEDHRAYLWSGLKLNLTVIDGSFECGFGLFVEGILEAVVFVKFALKAEIGVAFEFGDPGKDGDDPLVAFPIGAQATGSIGGKVKVGRSWGGELSGQSGLQLKDGELTMSRSRGFGFRGEVEWMGIKTTARMSFSGDGGLERDEGEALPAQNASSPRSGTKISAGTKIEPESWLQLPEVPPSKLGSWNFTSYESAVPLTPREVAEVFERAFDAPLLSRRWDIRVRQNLPLDPRPLLDLSSPLDPSVLRDPAASDRPALDAIRQRGLDRMRLENPVPLAPDEPPPDEVEGGPRSMDVTEAAQEAARAVVRHPRVRRHRAEIEEIARRAAVALQQEMVSLDGVFDLRPEVPYTAFMAFLSGVGDERPVEDWGNRGRNSLQTIIANVVGGESEGASPVLPQAPSAPMGAHVPSTGGVPQVGAAEAPADAYASGGTGELPPPPVLVA